MMKKNLKLWDAEEIAVLLEGYLAFKNGKLTRKDAIKYVSQILRAYACGGTVEVDAIFRNLAGITYQMASMESSYVGKTVYKPAMRSFIAMTLRYKNNQIDYVKLLDKVGTFLAKEKPEVYKSAYIKIRDTYSEDTKKDDGEEDDGNTRAQEIRDNELRQKYPLAYPKLQRVLKELSIDEKQGISIPRLQAAMGGMFRLNDIKEILDTCSWAMSDPSGILYLYSDKQITHKFISVDPLKLECKSEDVKKEDFSKHEEEKTIVSTREDIAFYFGEWLKSEKNYASKTVRSYVTAIRSIETFMKGQHISPANIYGASLKHVEEIIDFLKADASFVEADKTQHGRLSSAISNYREYLGFQKTNNEKTLEVCETCNKITTDGLQGNERAGERVLPDLVDKVEKLILDSSDGIGKEEICDRFSDCSTYQINLALEACHAVRILKKYYHPKNIYDYQMAADILVEVIGKQFSQNGDYTSAQQLYNEARPRLDDFFFYNNAFDSRQEVYDLAVHLFEKECYKGNTWIFSNNTHIWKKEPDYPKDYHGLLIKYAREHGNTFSREEAVSYFEKIGSATPAQTFSYVLFNTGSCSFLQYAENQFVITEALNINDYFLGSLTTQIEKLFDGDDYVATGEIDDYFYTTLPALPSGIIWSALLLEDILRIYETDFITIEAGNDNDKKTIPAAIVRKKSHYISFSDVVWNEVSKSFPLPKEFTASEFREFLLEKGFIRGSEKMWNVHKTVAGDIRFYWTDNNGRVTIN